LKIICHANPDNNLKSPCITTASHIYGLTRKEVMKLAYKFAKEMTKKNPK
jgi:hypothetical protein